MEYTPEKAVALTLEWHEGSPPESMAWWIILIVGRSFRPAEYLPHVPEPIREALRVRSAHPPRSVDDLLYANSSTYSSSFFEGLTPKEAEEKIRQSERKEKQETLDALHALHRYFANA